MNCETADQEITKKTTSTPKACNDECISYQNNLCAFFFYKEVSASDNCLLMKSGCKLTINKSKPGNDYYQASSMSLVPAVNSGTCTHLLEFSQDEQIRLRCMNIQLPRECMKESQCQFSFGTDCLQESNYVKIYGQSSNYFLQLPLYSDSSQKIQFTSWFYSNSTSCSYSLDPYKFSK